jgi:hypothetical protein
MIRRKVNRRHMIGDHHGRTTGNATLLVRAMDGILGTYRRRAGDSRPPVLQLIREPGNQPPAQRRAVTGNDTIEHGEAPAGEGP